MIAKTSSQRERCSYCICYPFLYSRKHTHELCSILFWYVYVWAWACVCSVYLCVLWCAVCMCIYGIVHVCSVLVYVLYCMWHVACACLTLSCSSKNVQANPYHSIIQIQYRKMTLALTLPKSSQSYQIWGRNFYFIHMKSHIMPHTMLLLLKYYNFEIPWHFRQYW